MPCSGSTVRQVLRAVSGDTDVDVGGAMDHGNPNPSGVGVPRHGTP
jgi:hypothetical protein